MDPSTQSVPAPDPLPAAARTDAVLWMVFIVLGTVTQLGFKLASQPLENVDFGLDWLRLAATTPALGVALTSYIATFALWIAILQRTPLSKAFLLTALVYVSVTLGSAWWLGERVNSQQLAGIGLVIGGIALLGVKRGALR